MKKTKSLALLAILAVATAFGADGIPGTVITANGATKGLVKWSVRNKCYMVAKKQGKTMIDVEIKADEVEELDIAKPAGWDQQAAVAMKGGSGAIGYFTKIMKEYAHLQWDMEAAKYLAETYLASGNAEKAFQTCRTVIGNDATLAYRGALAPSYWQCLIKLNKKSELEGALAKAAASGDRFTSGSALIARGDLIRSVGDAPDTLKQALTDGYLRVVLMYGDSEVAPLVRPEALYKAGQCFEKLGQAGRADAMRSELKRQYASSPWASK